MSDAPRTVAIALATLAFGLACASTPPPALERTRNDLARAQGTPDVADHASLELYEASKAVQRLEQAVDDGADADEIDHLAYLAEHRIQIAEQAGEAGAYREQLEELGERRQEIQLQARTIEAASAMERARQLEAQIGELKAEQTERGVVLSMSDVLFAFDRADLLPGVMSSLDEVARFLNDYPDRTVAVEGHTDTVGSEAYNQSLSQQRAQSVASYLERKGVDGDRISVSGFGETKPVAPNDNASGQQQNRRVEIILGNSGSSST